MVDVQHIDLCSGIGGFSLAASWLGWRTVAHSEVEPYCCKVYHRHFPDSACLGDVKEIDWHEIRKRFIANGETRIILTAGFPCQPSSTAGRRKGTDDERDLWPECARAVRELRPNYALFENVPGVLTVNGGRYFERILSDLFAVGYDAEWTVISAADIGAPHLRKRVWIVAYPDTGQGGYVRSDASSSSYPIGNTIETEGIVADSAIVCQGTEQERAGIDATRYRRAARDGEACGEGEGKTRKMADAECHGWQQSSEDICGRQPEPAVCGEDGDSQIARLPDWAGGSVEQPWPLTQLERSDDVVDSINDGWWITTGDPRDAVTFEDQTDKPSERETFVLLRNVLDGLPDGLAARRRRYTVRVRDRVKKLKALGNSIVPECAYVTMKRIDDAIGRRQP